MLQGLNGSGSWLHKINLKLNVVYGYKPSTTSTQALSCITPWPCKGPTTQLIRNYLPPWAQHTYTHSTRHTTRYARSHGQPELEFNNMDLTSKSRQVAKYFYISMLALNTSRHNQRSLTSKDPSGLSLRFSARLYCLQPWSLWMIVIVSSYIMTKSSRQAVVDKVLLLMLTYSVLCTSTVHLFISCLETGRAWIGGPESVESTQISQVSRLHIINGGNKEN